MTSHAIPPTRRSAEAEHLARAHVRYTGRVQGVGFRWRTYQCAAGLDVTGFVRNVADGSVEVVAEGPRAAVERFLAAVRQEMRDLIRDEQASWGAAGGTFRGFTISR